MSDAVDITLCDQPLGIVAGGGGLVAEVCDAMKAQSRQCVVAAIKGEADTSLTGTGTTWFDWGEIGRILKFFKKNGCKELMLIGQISKRPDFRSVLGDPGTLMRLPKIISAMTGGDDSLLKKVIRLIEAEDFQIVGVRDVAPDLIVNVGPLGQIDLKAELQADVEKGKAVLHDLGHHDIGQALVIHDGRVLAMEGAEGTDNMLRRVAALREEGRITRKRGTGILLKATKPDQDLRVDLPTIGPATIELAQQAGLSGLVLEAQNVLVVNRKETARLSDQHKLFVTGQRGF